MVVVFVIGLVFLASALLFIKAAVSRWRLSVASKNWPTAEGRVLESWISTNTVYSQEGDLRHSRHTLLTPT